MPQSRKGFHPSEDDAIVKSRVNVWWLGPGQEREMFRVKKDSEMMYGRESGGAANSSLTLDLEWVQLASSPLECKKGFTEGAARGRLGRWESWKLLLMVTMDLKRK